MTAPSVRELATSVGWRPVPRGKGRRFTDLDARAYWPMAAVIAACDVHREALPAAVRDALDALHESLTS